MLEDADVISSRDVARICHDVAAKIPPDRSAVEYDAEKLAFRQEIEDDWKKTLAKNPHAVMDLPFDPGDDDD